jgi:hypothetical protein
VCTHPELTQTPLMIYRVAITASLRNTNTVRRAGESSSQAASRAAIGSATVMPTPSPPITNPALQTLSPQNSPALPITPSSVGSVSMAQLISHNTPSQSSTTPAPTPSFGTVHSHTTRRCTSLPAQCLINSSVLQDPVLSDEYNNLPPLRYEKLCCVAQSP